MDLNEHAVYEPAASAAGTTSAEPATEPAAGDDARFQAMQQELLHLIGRYTEGVEGTLATAIEGLDIYRITCPTGPKHAVQKPVFAVIAQGSKRLFIGDEVYEYDPMHYLVASVDLPVVGKVTISSPEEPYLGLRLELDTREIGALIGDENLPQAVAADTAARGMYVNRLDAELLDAVLRLLRLHESPRDIPIMAPMIRREILYRLLMNGQGALLRQTVLQDSQMNRIAKAIRLMKDGYDQPLRVEDIARDVHMSVSSLHHHFKLVTAMSPLQYQKNLRLQEARKLILTADMSVALAAHTVGYESSSQFSREYSRLFGAPPLRDKRRWLEEEAPVL
ncbi:AraC family transcriptional regulator [Herbaspirillum sp. LeCh32-8]|uniref:AraC family transcriptional regulator n=1 Tax=Herbaspirillum sp. LeCh32-8 TaxID=2821356 RepID=UPI001AE42846|nr:AraC family transcriptional regulator [Herbaspirillum sp. LeCh32-8]MBP0598535.1 AraC family transcriptional regulator [Herbaspirillum sp. LeCh32-8]